MNKAFAKKASVLILCVILLFALFACGQSTASAPPAPQSSSAPPAAAPPPVQPAAKASVLTGHEVAPDYGGGHRVAAVMVNNQNQSRPQRGLSSADILLETQVEGGITRFMALYEDYAAMPEVGPVRGFRESYLQLAMPFQPLLIVSPDGAQQPVSLNVGTTYMALADVQQAPNFTISPGGNGGADNAYCPYAV